MLEFVASVVEDENGEVEKREFRAEFSTIAIYYALEIL